MAKWRPKNIYIYFNDIFGSMGENCLPYMPESFTCNINGRNEEIDILHGVGSDEGLAGTMNFVKRPGLKTWSIECFFSHPDRPLYATVSRSHHWTPEFWVEFFESAMYQQKVLEMTVSGLDIVTYVTIENFKHTKEAGEEIDTYYTIEIKEYQFQEIKQETINIVQEVPKYDGQNINQQATKPNIDINNDGNCVWLYGRAWQNADDSKVWALRNPCVDKSYNKTLFFSWLKCKILNKHNETATSIKLTSDGEEIALEVYSKIMTNIQEDNNLDQDIYGVFKNAIIKVLTTTKWKNTKYNQYTNQYVNCFNSYTRLLYGSLSMKMTYNVFKEQEVAKRKFFTSLMSGSDYQIAKSSSILSSAYKTQIKARDGYSGNFLNDMALAEVIGAKRICQIEAQEGYSYTGSAGDLKRLEYQGTQSSNIAYTLNKGDKMWCLEDDIRLKNDSNIPFSLTYYSE